MLGSGEVEVDVDVEEVVEVDGIKPSSPAAAEEPAELVLVFEIEVDGWGGNRGGTCWI